MASKKAIPHQLYGEFSEYSSLLRALRTEAIQDVSSQLSQSIGAGPSSPLPPQTPRNPSPWTSPIRGPRQESGNENEPEIDDDELDAELERVIHPSPRTLGKRPAHRTSSIFTSSPAASIRPTKKRRVQKEITEFSSRWPLLAGDTFIPEWTLGDEVAAITRSVLSRTARLQASASEDVTQTEEDTTLRLNPTTIHGLTDHISHLLTDIFTLIAAHRPVVAPSLQNRLAPMDWKRLLHIVSNSEAVHSSVIENVEMRMRKLSNQSDEALQEGSLLTHRANILANSRKSLATLEAEIFQSSIGKDVVTGLDAILHLTPLSIGLIKKARKKAKMTLEADDAMSTPPRRKSKRNIQRQMTPEDEDEVFSLDLEEGEEDESEYDGGDNEEEGEGEGEEDRDDYADQQDGSVEDDVELERDELRSVQDDGQDLEGQVQQSEEEEEAEEDEGEGGDEEESTGQEHLQPQVFMDEDEDEKEYDEPQQNGVEDGEEYDEEESELEGSGDE